MSLTDREILERAYDRETDPRTGDRASRLGWEYHTVGARLADINQLLGENLVEIVLNTRDVRSYRLTEKGRGLVAMVALEHAQAIIPAATLMQAFDLIVGYQDLKEVIARAIESRRRINVMLEGPPACAKSLFLEAIRGVVPTSYLAFGSRTSAAGISDALFEHHPTVLLLDEANFMDNDVYAVLLGLMESGEILETKSKKTRGVVLNTVVIAACNTSEKMPDAFLSRFAMHAVFPAYTRAEFVQVCEGFLPRAEACPVEIARSIGEEVYDRQLGDVRKARAVWQLMNAPTLHEMHAVLQGMLKYNGTIMSRGASYPRRVRG